MNVDDFVYTIREEGRRHCERKDGVVLEFLEYVPSVDGTFEQVRLVFIEVYLAARPGT